MEQKNQSLNMEDKIYTIKNLSFLDVHNIVESVRTKSCSSPHFSAQVIPHVTLFDNTRTHISISLMSPPANIIVANVKIYIPDTNTDYAFIHDLYVNPEVRYNHFSTFLMELAIGVIRDLGFKGFYLHVTKGTWMEEWYKRMGYIVDEEHCTEEYVQFYKDFK